MSPDSSSRTVFCPVTFWRFDRELKRVKLETAGLSTSPAYPIVGDSIQWEEIPEDQRQRLAERILKVFETGWRLIMEDRIGIKAETKRFQSTYIPEFDSNGKVVAVLMSFCDITALDQWEAMEEEPEGLTANTAAV